MCLLRALLSSGSMMNPVTGEPVTSSHHNSLLKWRKFETSWFKRQIIKGTCFSFLHTFIRIFTEAWEMQKLAAQVILNSCFQHTWRNFEWEKEGNASEIEEAEKTTWELSTQQHCRPVLRDRWLPNYHSTQTESKSLYIPTILITASFMAATWCTWLLEMWRVWSKKWADVTTHLEKEFGHRRQKWELRKHCFLGSCYCACSHWQGEHGTPYFLNGGPVSVDN